TSATPTLRLLPFSAAASPSAGGSSLAPVWAPESRPTRWLLPVTQFSALAVSSMSSARYACSLHVIVGVSTVGQRATSTVVACQLECGALPKPSMRWDSKTDFLDTDKKSPWGLSPRYRFFGN
ncbi:unnamed protein product, partial [Ectocarpus sp. 12 AP-2014]